MTEQDIADYLKNHPDFFTHRPELLQQLSIPHSHEEGTISLVEAQLAQQREQIKTLTQLLEKFHQLAHQEADIFFEDRSGHILNDELLSRLISMPNVIVTSHQAFLTEEALNNIAETTVGNILSYFENDGICDNELCYRCGNIERCKKERKEKCF